MRRKKSVIFLDGIQKKRKPKGFSVWDSVEGEGIKTPPKNQYPLLHPYPGFSEFDGAMVRKNCPKSPIRPSCPNLCPQEKRKDEEILAKAREKKVALIAAMMTESGKKVSPFLFGKQKSFLASIFKRN